MSAENADVLPRQASLVWASDRISTDIHTIVILPSGWLSVLWTSGNTSYVSPAVVAEIRGKGVSYG